MVHLEAETCTHISYNTVKRKYDYHTKIGMKHNVTLSIPILGMISHTLCIFIPHLV
jgi:hypothetical protein